MKVKLEILDAVPPALSNLIDGELSDFNATTISPSNRQELAIAVTDNGRYVGGLIGNTAWGWLFVQSLWISDEFRGQGLAGGMLAEAEKVALQRKCHAAWIDTFNPVAKRVYERAGFRVFGELSDFPVGYTRFLLQKRLVPD